MKEYVSEKQWIQQCRTISFFVTELLLENC